MVLLVGMGGVAASGAGCMWPPMQRILRPTPHFSKMNLIS
ncbi:hypothetical protein BSLA_02f3887 [Burkholderia stabilis]|nr:hypothetical protein BSLA_02f3887 [Burkholderia stabilis]